MNRIDQLLEDRKKITDSIRGMETALSYAANAVQEAEAEGLAESVREIQRVDQLDAKIRESLRDARAWIVGIDAQLAELQRTRSNP